ncbi:4a-hydroxytetrahydrobiopterin dehydratase [Nocardiopsis kunsanensis]|uniref:4a-hydroxytetrahydrobiopterin dehydratase n=1 Tax=Nocardiopsis kunsanensis TaxID=141693 RepID=UPI00034906F5|nr:4a-hydroxytetrahydrobiopterin dehydratase [Nocardiopsis kunsanensis]
MQLTDAQIDEGLGRLQGWERDGSAPVIRRTVRLPGFTQAIALVGDIAQAAEQADHHPDIDIRFNKVHLALSTHSEGALTEKDLSLAARIDELVPAHEH